MINYFEQEDFDSLAYTIEGGRVVQHVFRDLCRAHAEKVAAPDGVRARMHLRDNELWSWGPAGRYAVPVASFSSREEAEHALLLSFRQDLFASETVVYGTREQAENALREMEDAA